MDLRISPDGRWLAFAVKAVSPLHDGYRTAIWLAPSDGSTPARQLTLGAKTDNTPRWSPDGRLLAFISDRGAVLQAAGAGETPTPAIPPESGQAQVWVLPLEGGEARQVSRLPEDVTDVAWSPDGTRLVLVSSATTSEPRKPARQPSEPPEPDARLIDRLGYMYNGQGYIYDKPLHLWVLEFRTGEPRRLTRARVNDEAPAWSPDGRRIAFVSRRHRDPDLDWRSDIYTVDVEDGTMIRVSGGSGEQVFTTPEWSPDGRSIAAIGHRFPAGAGSRADVWRFRAVERDAGVDLTAESDLMVGAAMNSDLFAPGEARLHWTQDGRWIVFAAPFEGSYELWRVEVATKKVERLTRGQHHLAKPDLAEPARGPLRVALIVTTGSTPPDVATVDIPSGPLGSRDPAIRLLSDLTGADWRDVEIVRPAVRWHRSEGRRIQGWFIRAPGTGEGKPAPLVVQIHGGPQTLYGWSLFWEWQCLAAAGISVYACNPRGSQGYGEEFCAANFRDWGDGPMRDVLAGVDRLIEEGVADPDRLGVTGGSYGGYLTTWIVGHTDRFKAAVTCRSVSDLTSQMLSGDISGPNFGRLEFGAQPWDEPEVYRWHSPLSYVRDIRTPLLIQHAENDLRCPVTQAEQLFAALRSLRRPVRLMRVPEENHELTRSGAPFRRVENVERIRDWFVHYLIEGKSGLPPARRPSRARPAARRQGARGRVGSAPSGKRARPVIGVRCGR